MNSQHGVNANPPSETTVTKDWLDDARVHNYNQALDDVTKFIEEYFGGSNV